MRGVTLNKPALLKRISTVPYAAMVSSKIFWMSSTLAMSAITAIASPPAALISSTTAFALSSFLPVTTTFAPSAANLFAVSRPIPEVEPVIIATFPSSLPITIPSLN